MSAIPGLILLPLAAAVLASILRGPKLRAALVAVTGVALVGLSALLLWQGAGGYTPDPVLGVEWSWIVTLADYALLLLVLGIGIARRSWQVVTFTVLQAAGLVWLEGFAHPRLTGTVFVADALATALVLVACVVGSAIVVFALRYLPEHEEHLHLIRSKGPRFFFFLLAFLGAMNGLALANHLPWLYFFWEVTTLCSFFLIGHDGTDEAKRNATRALWMNSLGGAAFVGGMVALVLQGRALSLDSILAAGPVVGNLALLPLALLVFAGFTKAAQLPFQGWLLGAMVAPTPVSALLHSSTMVKAGVYLVIRLAPAYAGTDLSTAVVLAGGFTFLAAAALAVGQSNAKRVLAYSTISNLGLIVLCAGLDTPAAIAAAILLLVFHAVSKAMLFLAVGAIEHAIGSRDIEAMEGLVDTHPKLAGLVVAGALSMLLPPFGVLIAKWAAVEAAMAFPPAAVILALGSAITAVFWVKWTGRVLSGGVATEPVAVDKLGVRYGLPLFGLIFLAIALSAFVGPVAEKLIAPAVAEFYRVPGLAAAETALETTTGRFPTWPLFVTLGLVLVVPLFAFRARPGQVRPVYACGEGFERDGKLVFRGAGDKPLEVSTGAYYLDGVFGEANLVRPSNLIAIALLVFLVGVSCL
jgi:ech hydrogenase subunit A